MKAHSKFRIQGFDFKTQNLTRQPDWKFLFRQHIKCTMYTSPEGLLEFEIKNSRFYLSIKLLLLLSTIKTGSGIGGSDQVNVRE